MERDRPTILVEQYRAAAVDDHVNSDAYKGLRIHALPGLHDFIGAKVVEHCKPGAALLDLAAGSGAMSLRLHDLGFDVTATDYVPENFKLDAVPFRQADLNGDFASGAAFAPQTFDAVVASEIIEHLENPRHFARECRRLLRDGGRLVLSTPNVESASSKALYLRSGSFAWFSEKDYATEGHITPLTQWQIDKAFTEAGFRFVWRGSFGSGLRLVEGSPRLRWLARVVERVSGLVPALGGEIFVAVLERLPDAAPA